MNRKTTQISKNNFDKFKEIIDTMFWDGKQKNKNNTIAEWSEWTTQIPQITKFKESVATTNLGIIRKDESYEFLKLFKFINKYAKDEPEFYCSFFEHQLFFKNKLIEDKHFETFFSNGINKDVGNILGLNTFKKMIETLLTVHPNLELNAFNIFLDLQYKKNKITPSTGTLNLLAKYKGWEAMDFLLEIGAESVMVKDYTSIFSNAENKKDMEELLKRFDYVQQYSIHDIETQDTTLAINQKVDYFYIMANGMEVFEKIEALEQHYKKDGYDFNQWELNTLLNPSYKALLHDLLEDPPYNIKYQQSFDFIEKIIKKYKHNLNHIHQGQTVKQLLKNMELPKINSEIEILEKLKPNQKSKPMQQRF